MRPLSNSAVLDLWERGSGLHPLDQGLLILNWALPGLDLSSLADSSLGTRNRLLIDLHCSFFGPVLEGWSACIACDEKMEMAIDCRELVRDVAETSSDTIIQFQGQRFRLPTSRDLAEAVQAGDSNAAALCLIQRCNLNPESVSDWSPADVEQIGEAMAAADPLAEMKIVLRCPACGHQFTEILEIASFIWSKIEARVKRVIWEIHLLASAYGWSEEQILGLTPARRSAYLEMLQL